MPVPTSAAMVFLELLADRKLQPAGVLLSCGADAAPSLPGYASQPDFRSLAARVPCFVAPDTAAGLAPEAAAALAQAGCRTLPPAQLLRTDRLPGPSLAPGVQWVAGDWLLQPPAKPAANQSASRAQSLRLLQLVAADADTHEIEAVFRQDPALSYHLLRLVNSLSAGQGRQITSFAQAILMLGRQQLRRWINLMLFSSRADDARSAMLLARVATRARSMELLAAARGQDKADQEKAFMAGMFSVLGVLFGAPLAEVLRPLAVGEAMLGALLQNEGELGALLRLVQSAEQAAATDAAALLQTLELTPADLQRTALQATGWMFEVTRESRGDGHA